MSRSLRDTDPAVRVGQVYQDTHGRHWSIDGADLDAQGQLAGLRVRLAFAQPDRPPALFQMTLPEFRWLASTTAMRRVDLKP